MTLGIIWARTVGGIREMVVASDSRLSGGQPWDANPKIMLLPRSDAVLSFGGDTDDAYPLMLQVWNAINMFDPAKNRSMYLADLKGISSEFLITRENLSGIFHGGRKPQTIRMPSLLSAATHGVAAAFIFGNCSTMRPLAGSHSSLQVNGAARTLKHTS